MVFMNCTVSTVRVYQALVKSMLWGSSTCWKDKHFCNGRKLYTLQIVYLALQIIVSYFLSVHTVFVFVCAPQVQPVEGGECRCVWGSCKEGCSLQCVSTSRWAVSCFEIRPVSLVPIWDGKRSGIQDLPHNVKTYTYVRGLCWRISFRLQWRVRDFILIHLLHLSGSAKAHERGGCAFCDSKHFCHPNDFDYQCPCDWHRYEHTRQALSFEANIRKYVECLDRRLICSKGSDLNTDNSISRT